MANIDVRPAGGGSFRVTVSESGSTTTHDVTVDSSDAARLAPQHTPEQLIAASFRFLLEREPKEAILGRFDLTVIGRYFPEYASRVGDYL